MDMKTQKVNDLRSRLAAGETLIGTFLNLGSPIAAEIAGLASFDWVIIDLEHGSGSESNLVSQLQALDAYDTVPIVRVEDNSRPRYSFALDRGAAGIMVPRVDSALDAASAVSFLRYPPDGVRGVASLNRACDFGTRTAEVIPSFNQTVLGIMQIESATALEEVDEIAETEGVDVLFVGPMDLSHSMGIPGDLEHPRFQTALKRVAESARAAGKSAGIHVASASRAGKYAGQGFGMIAVGSDSSLMLAAMRETIEAADDR